MIAIASPSPSDLAKAQSGFTSIPQAMSALSTGSYQPQPTDPSAQLMALGQAQTQGSQAGPDMSQGTVSINPQTTFAQAAQPVQPSTPPIGSGAVPLPPAITGKPASQTQQPGQVPQVAPVGQVTAPTVAMPTPVQGNQLPPMAPVVLPDLDPTHTQAYLNQQPNVDNAQAIVNAFLQRMQGLGDRQGDITQQMQGLQLAPPNVRPMSAGENNIATLLGVLGALGGARNAGQATQGYLANRGNAIQQDYQRRMGQFQGQAGLLNDQLKGIDSSVNAAGVGVNAAGRNADLAQYRQAQAGQGDVNNLEKNFQIRQAAATAYEKLMELNGKHNADILIANQKATDAINGLNANLQSKTDIANQGAQNKDAIANANNQTRFTLKKMGDDTILDFHEKDNQAAWNRLQATLTQRDGNDRRAQALSAWRTTYDNDVKTYLDQTNQSDAITKTLTSGLLNNPNTDPAQLLQKLKGLQSVVGGEGGNGLLDAQARIQTDMNSLKTLMEMPSAAFTTPYQPQSGGGTVSGASFPASSPTGQVAQGAPSVLNPPSAGSLPPSPLNPNMQLTSALSNAPGFSGSKEVGGVNFDANTGNQFAGQKYELGGTGKGNAIDCSSFTRACYAEKGLYLPRTAAEQISPQYSTRVLAPGQPLDASRLQPGDLVGFTPVGRATGHVGIITAIDPQRGPIVKHFTSDHEGNGLHEEPLSQVIANRGSRYLGIFRPKQIPISQGGS